MKIRVTFVIVSILAAAFAALVCVNYRREMRVTRTRISSGSQVVNTPCGMLEYADVGSGMKTILATPPADFKNAIPEEQERVLEVLRNILPISERERGLKNDTAVAPSVPRYDLEHLVGHGSDVRSELAGFLRLHEASPETRGRGIPRPLYVAVRSRTR